MCGNHWRSPRVVLERRARECEGRVDGVSTSFRCFVGRGGARDVVETLERR